LLTSLPYLAKTIDTIRSLLPSLISRWLAKTKVISPTTGQWPGNGQPSQTHTGVLVSSLMMVFII